MSVRGFILQPTYRIEAGRPVVHLYGRLETGETFLVRDDRQVPHFYIAAEDAERAKRLGGGTLVPSDRRSLDGRPVVRVDLRKPSDTPPLRDRWTAAGIPCFEADVRFAMRFLIDRRIQGALAISGPSERGERISRVYHNPELAPAGWTPELSVLSIDIETDPKIRRLLSIALHGCGASEVLLFSPEDWETPDGAVGFRKEAELLAAFCRRVRELDPDILTGWNVVDFDLQVLFRLARTFGQSLDIARGPSRAHLRESRMPWSTHEAVVPGRLVIDGIHLLRGAFIQMDSYALDAVAREVLAEGKVSTTVSVAVGARPADFAPDEGKAQEILHAFRHDRERFVRYNATDARLVIDILDKLRLLELAVERSRLTGLPLDRISGSIAAFDFLYLSELHRRGVVAPSVGAEDGEGEGLGGYVMEPVTGLHHNVLVFDFKSLYPSLIRTFQVDPLGFLPDPTADDDPILAPNGAAFRRQPGILTEMLDQLFPRRQAAKDRGDGVGSHAIKILMNSFYGVLGTRACRFYRPQLASAITSLGQEVLLWSRGRCEELGFRVLYGDTDSLFVLSGETEAGEAQAAGERLALRLTRDVADWIAEKWRLKSRLELELETLYRQLFLPAMRGGGGGARKRYVGLVGEGEDAEVVFTGMEVVRRDWTELAKRVQRELYHRLFAGEPVEHYLAQVVDNLRQGRLDDLLVYRKGLRKNLAEYTSSTPPHVAAARKLSRPPGRVIAYVMTEAGAEPESELEHPVDHEHYVQKQIRPVAEPVLAQLELDFDRVIGDDAQLELF